MRATSTLIKKILPWGILTAGLAAIVLINANPPKARRGAPEAVYKIPVETMIVQQAPYQLTIESFGTIRPRTQSDLLAQVSGQIVAVSEQFREGGFFAAGDVLVQLDARDYQANVDIARSALISARQLVMEEEARAAQAHDNWQRLGETSEPSDLVLRLPQLAAAKAAVISAEAQLIQAELALERTAIMAPYAGRVLSKQADVGQVVSSNGVLATIYASDYVEVRLPIKNRDLPLAILPETTLVADQEGVLSPEPVAVTVYSDLIGDQQWQAVLRRTEGAIDEGSQQLFVVAQIDDPYTQPDTEPANTGHHALKIGQYVTAKFAGKRLLDALRIPTPAIYQGSYVYVEQDSKIYRREIEILWQNSSDTLIKSGLKHGEHLVTTSLGLVTSGAEVEVTTVDTTLAIAQISTDQASVVHESVEPAL